MSHQIVASLARLVKWQIFFSWMEIYIYVKSCNADIAVALDLFFEQG